jgi:hypothetical protein
MTVEWRKWRGTQNTGVYHPKIVKIETLTVVAVPPRMMPHASTVPQCFNCQRTSYTGPILDRSRSSTYSARTVPGLGSSIGLHGIEFPGNKGLISISYISTNATGVHPSSAALNPLTLPLHKLCRLRSSLPPLSGICTNLFGPG